MTDYHSLSNRELDAKWAERIGWKVEKKTNPKGMIPSEYYEGIPPINEEEEAAFAMAQVQYRPKPQIPYYAGSPYHDAPSSTDDVIHQMRKFGFQYYCKLPPIAENVRNGEIQFVDGTHTGFAYVEGNDWRRAVVIAALITLDCIPLQQIP